MHDLEMSVIAVVGLGYVGLPLALAFAEKYRVIGFDTNEKKIESYRNKIDPTGEMDVSNTTIEFTTNPGMIEQADFVIVAVPTPVRRDNSPDLRPLISATEIIAEHLKKDAVVIYESTVFPGATEKVCIPILEEKNGKCGEDFSVGYSPERINPGDKVHTFKNITKITSGYDEETCRKVDTLYASVVDKTFPVSNIRTAEAVKVSENSQRDINIAFINELAMVFDKMNIDTNEVVDGMNTKWNALGFRPGLVGGHCIGVDPYYLTREAERYGYHSKIVINGRIVNDEMAEYIADCTVREMINAGQAPKNGKTYILGITFKENCMDTRNSKVYDIIKRLNEYGIEPIVVDPVAEGDYYKFEDIKDADCLIFAVAHDQFKIKTKELKKMLKPNGVVIDVKNLFPIKELNEEGLNWWKL